MGTETTPAEITAGAWARLIALACLAALVVALIACVQFQQCVTRDRANARQDARVELSLRQSIAQAYVDGDLELADSLERLWGVMYGGGAAPGTSGEGDRPPTPPTPIPADARPRS